LNTNVAAVVVLYNPGMQVINNITSFLYQVDRLYVVDNSEMINNDIVEEINKLSHTKYIRNNSNLGIAAALNIGAKLAINENYDYILTMDDDSIADDSLVKNLLHHITKSDGIAIVSPYQIDEQYPVVPKKLDSIHKDSVWTSGNLLNLKAFAKTDGFKEEFFMDYIDHEFCLRLQKIGYKIIQDDSILLRHKCGSISQHKFFTAKVYTTNHSPVRLFYRTRNRFVTQKIYGSIFPEFVKRDRIEFVKELIKILLYEKLKSQKLVMIIKGYWYHKTNHLGKYSKRK
jgi:rhamnosyltransferase